MSERQRYIEQTLIQERYPPFSVTLLHENALTRDRLVEFLATASKRAIGIAPSYTNTGTLAVIALATKSQVLLIQVYSPGKQRDKPPQLTGRQHLQDLVYCDSSYPLYAFDAHNIAVSIYLDMHLYVSGAIDLQSATPNNTTRDPFKTVKALFGEEIELYDTNINDIFKDELWEQKRSDQLAQRAWLCQCIGEFDGAELQLGTVPRIDTSQWSDSELDVLARISRDASLLDSMKPTSVNHDFASNWNHKEGKLTMSGVRFQNRFRKSSKQSVRLEFGTTEAFSVTSQMASVAGKQARLDIAGNLEGKTIQSVTTLGKEDPTQAELQRSLIVLHTLQRKIPLFKNIWIQKLWVASSDETSMSTSTWADLPSNTVDPWFTPLTPDNQPGPSVEIQSSTLSSQTSFLPSPPISFTWPLNDSQSHAVTEMLAHTREGDITVVHGPPGTGKTTVIAAFVSSILQGSKRAAWLTAKSNVAVKNIAEKLTKCGLYNWKLIVSADFHFGWHEHLYRTLPQENVIVSDQLTPKHLQGCKIILCTISMLCNRRFQNITKAIPVETLVIDEASQIEIGEYFPILSNFGKSLQKICFIGDDKQLPPYGQDNIASLESIFEKSHLRKNALFLDTQYRMPVEIGNFISRNVYNDTLRSNPQHPIQSKLACQFFDIVDGKEELDGNSWKNLMEVEAVIYLAEWLASKGRQYRIITPYDSQRSMIELALKDKGLSWHDKCFNVDSFQGNEDDHIIISVVRSHGVGFLQDLRRTNVMLSRCKEAMYICSSSLFLEKVAGQTLIGRMAKEWATTDWVKWDDLVGGNFRF